MEEIEHSTLYQDVSHGAVGNDKGGGMPKFATHGLKSILVEYGVRMRVTQTLYTLHVRHEPIF